MKSYITVSPDVNIQPTNYSLQLNPKDYIPCEQLFPEWSNAREALNSYCSKTKRLIAVQGKEATSLEITINIDKHIEQIIKMPEELFLETANTITNIINEIVPHYIPELDHYLSSKITDYLLVSITHECIAYEDQIINEGYFSLQDAIRFKLGVLF